MLTSLMLLLIVSCASVHTGRAQQRPTSTVISGFVTDGSNGQRLAGSNVVLQNERQEVTGAISNDDGFYQIEVDEAGTYVMQVSYIGYAPYIERTVQRV